MHPLHEISFLANKTLHQFRTRMDPDFASVVYKAIASDAGLVLSDIQVYMLSEEDRGGAASELVEILDDAKEDDHDLLTALQKAAHDLDLETEHENATQTTVLVEFVWDNGGGDDNAFGQGVSINPEAKSVNDAFFQALEAYLDTGVAYAFATTPQSDLEGNTHELRDALEYVYDVMTDILDQPPVKLDALLDAFHLDAATPAVQPSRPHPRL